MIELDFQKKNLAIVGCSYTHYYDGNCLFESYPALVAKQYKDYNVIDLSVPGGTNDSVYYRIRSFEKEYNIKFDKVIFQITHYNRFLYMPKYDWKKHNIYREVMQKENYIYTDGEYDDQDWINVTVGFLEQDNSQYYNKQYYDETLKRIQSLTKVHRKSWQSYVMHYMESDVLVLILQKEIDLVNAVYGEENVLFFSWHAAIDTTKDNNSVIMLELPKNYVGSVEKMLGENLFYKAGVDDAPHYDNKGMMLVFKKLKPSLDRLLIG